MPLTTSLRTAADLQFPTLSLDADGLPGRVQSPTTEMEYESTSEDNNHEGPGDDNFEVISHPDRVYSSDDESLSSYRPSESGGEACQDQGAWASPLPPRIAPTQHSSDGLIDSELTTCTLERSNSSYDHLDSLTIVSAAASTSSRPMPTSAQTKFKLKLNHPLRVMYHGPAEAKASVVEKIAQAITWSAAHCDRADQGDLHSRRMNIIPLPPSRDNQERSQVTVIPSTGLEMDVYDCPTCEGYTSAMQMQDLCRAANSLCQVRHGNPDAPIISASFCRDFCHRDAYCEDHKDKKSLYQQQRTDLSVIVHDLHDNEDLYRSCAVPCSVNFASKTSMLPTLNILDLPYSKSSSLSASSDAYSYRIRNHLQQTGRQTRVIEFDQFLDMPDGMLSHELATITGLTSEKRKNESLFRRFVQEGVADRFGLIRLALAFLLLSLLSYAIVLIIATNKGTSAPINLASAVSSGPVFTSAPSWDQAGPKAPSIGPELTGGGSEACTAHRELVTNAAATALDVKHMAHVASLEAKWISFAVQEWVQYSVKELLEVIDALGRLVHSVIVDATIAWREYAEAIGAFNKLLRRKSEDMVRSLTKHASNSYALTRQMHSDVSHSPQGIRNWYVKAKGSAKQLAVAVAGKRKKFTQSVYDTWY